MSTENLVSIIIVNYNGLGFLGPCFKSIETAFHGYRYEIVVVDNNSTDGSDDFLKNYPGIVYVKSEVNLGFTGGNNLGVSHAKGNYLLFLNNDTLVETSLDAMIDALGDPDVGIVGCRLVYGDLRQQFSFGYEHTPSRVLLSWLGLEKKYTLPSIFRRMETNPDEYLVSRREVDWVSGACFSMRKSDWDRLGGFDTAFFMYCEDVDLCSRARGLGLRVAYLSECRVIHFEGGGKIWIGEAALMRTARSYQIYTEKHYGHLKATVLSLCLSGVYMIRALVFFLHFLYSKRNSHVSEIKYKGFGRVSAFLISSVFDRRVLWAKK